MVHAGDDFPMASPTKEPLLEILRKSGLVDEREIDRLVEVQPQAASDSMVAADLLASTKLVTSWQLERLREGRWRGYFLGKYKILGQLGAGAMGSVFLAEHRVMRHQVAIKVLAKRLTGKPEYVKRFEQEARAAAVVSHPRLVRAFDIDSDGDLHYFVMEYVAGEDLQKIVLRDGPLPVSEAAECIRQTAEGLSAAHAAGLIHRDIKPSNLLLDPGGQVHILDLGLARMVIDDEPSLTLVQDARMIGTVDYLSPEQARNSHEIDPRADLYSLGCTLYFLLSGQPPFAEGTIPQRVIAHQTQRPVSIRKKRPEVDAPLEAILSKLLAKKAERRFASAAEVEQVLAAWQASAIDRVHALIGPLGSGRGGSSVYSASDSAACASTSGDDLALLPLDGADTDPAAPMAGRSTLSGTRDPRASVSSSASKNSISAAPLETKSAAKSAAKVLQQPATQLEDSTLLTPLDDPLASLLELPPGPDLASLDPLASATLSPASLPHEPLSTQQHSAPSEAAPPQKFRDRLLALVARSEGDGTGGLSYSLWFLILFGICTGLVIAGLGYSYVQSFTRQAPIQKSME